MSSLEQRFPNKRVLITGTTSGLGRALSIEFGQRGWKVAVSGLDPAAVKQTADLVRAAGGEAMELQLDVTKPEDFAAAARCITAGWGGLDVLVNNAGVSDGGRLEDGLSLDNWRLLMDVNMWSIIHGCRAFIPVLRKCGGGHILNVASGAGLLCLPEMASYNASKAAAIAISETLKTELITDNIDVTVLCPTAFQSNIANNERVAQCTSVAARGIMEEIKKSKVTAESVARYAIRSMEKGKLYSLPQADARLMWAISRWLPENYRNLLTTLFNRRLWLFAPGTTSAAAAAGKPVGN
ncbi:SDR family NAD(P)-dependent oxidoreductase [Aromatoleum toluolicum]|uniref:SDR family NAD(P)-dependent oxidoreductase n=1 Tax=Aromatoleum toluolicum TaxID=90060 RepID=A0ABX1NLS2_9RHOO|nr:SDR family NAD(P)-dependent oxidoreductase [Aromatoleum toluolicum]NMG00287.1 SDR family NAD(P)-dependent oxidoreductase [Aromatoleum toluolicum]